MPTRSISWTPRHCSTVRGRSRRRLSRLAADLLDLSRIDAEVNLRSEPIELGELGRAVLAEFELASSGRGVALTLREDSRPAWALADPAASPASCGSCWTNGLRVTTRQRDRG